ncbi:Calcium/calmodulin-dependent protein kinase type IV, partial [Quaeritorhiza haematococci]
NVVSSLRRYLASENELKFSAQVEAICAALETLTFESRATLSDAFQNDPETTLRLCLNTVDAATVSRRQAAVIRNQTKDWLQNFETFAKLRRDLEKLVGSARANVLDDFVWLWAYRFNCESVERIPMVLDGHLSLFRHVVQFYGLEITDPVELATEWEATKEHLEVVSSSTPRASCQYFIASYQLFEEGLELSNTSAPLGMPKWELAVRRRTVWMASIGVRNMVVHLDFLAFQVDLKRRKHFRLEPPLDLGLNIPPLPEFVAKGCLAVQHHPEMSMTPLWTSFQPDPQCTDRFWNALAQICLFFDPDPSCELEEQIKVLFWWPIFQQLFHPLEGFKLYPKLRSGEIGVHPLTQKVDAVILAYLHLSNFKIQMHLLLVEASGPRRTAAHTSPRVLLDHKDIRKMVGLLRYQASRVDNLDEELLLSLWAYGAFVSGPQIQFCCLSFSIHHSFNAGAGVVFFDFWCTHNWLFDLAEELLDNHPQESAPSVEETDLSDNDQDLLGMAKENSNGKMQKDELSLLSVQGCRWGHVAEKLNKIQAFCEEIKRSKTRYQHILEKAGFNSARIINVDEPGISRQTSSSRSGSSNDTPKASRNLLGKGQEGIPYSLFFAVSAAKSLCTDLGLTLDEASKEHHGRKTTTFLAWNTSAEQQTKQDTVFIIVKDTTRDEEPFYHSIIPSLLIGCKVWRRLRVYALRHTEEIPSGYSTRKLLNECGKLLTALRHNTILHRDIKPEHLRYDPQADQVVLIDYDLAVQKDEVLGECAGTRGFIAPEVEERELHTHASDIWSTGRTIQVLLEKKVLAMVADDVGVKRVVEGMVAKDPRIRLAAVADAAQI